MGASKTPSYVAATCCTHDFRLWCLDLAVAQPRGRTLWILSAAVCRCWATTQHSHTARLCSPLIPRLTVPTCPFCVALTPWQDTCPLPLCPQFPPPRPRVASTLPPSIPPSFDVRADFTKNKVGMEYEELTAADRYVTAESADNEPLSSMKQPGDKCDL